MKLIATLGMASLLVAALGLPLRADANDVFSYRALCDASAAVALGANHFAVADDELNTLRIYQRGHAGPVGSLALAAFLDTKEDKESDLEAAAAIGTRMYWISSHGRNASGKAQERRYRFFATDVLAGPIPTLVTVGQPYSELLDDLKKAPSLKGYKLADAAKLAPEAAGGLNIEGLAATPDGKLLIGFRNPVPGGSALIVTLENPKDVIEGKKAKFGLPITLDLKGRGIRSIELVSGARYLIIAGPTADNGSFALFRWSGKSGAAAQAMPQLEFDNFRPEALFAIPQTDTVQILSDDGGVKLDGMRCKDQEKSTQSFRSMIVKP